MRRALVVSVIALAAVVGSGTALRSSAGAARTAVKLTIHATPNPAVVGDRVVISGQLIGSGDNGMPVLLWQRLGGKRRFFHLLTTWTGRSGRYRFARRLAPLQTNRQWFVTSDGRGSRIVSERVAPLISLSASVPTAITASPVTFSGQVTPSHAAERVQLQEAVGASWQLGPATRWQTVASTTLDRRSSYTLNHSFTATGSDALRVVFAGDRRNTASYSAPVTVVITPPLVGIHKIQHVVIIMQENRSFDSYFGTYPGADGIPGVAGNPGPLPCVPNPDTAGCVSPYLDHSDVNNGGPHGMPNGSSDMDCTALATRTGCKMDGFVAQAEKGQGCTTAGDPACSPCTEGNQTVQCDDVMGYHDGSDIPNYWTYANDFVLQDHMFEPVLSWSLPEHTYLVSGWSATCTTAYNPYSCVNSPAGPNPISGLPQSNTTPYYAWTDVTYLLARAGVSWAYYVFQGTEPDCELDTAVSCKPVPQNQQTPSIWNPLPHFTDVQQDDQLGNIQSASNFFTAAKTGTLPAVSWIIPSGCCSEHPPAKVSTGQRYVTGLINTIMQSPDWWSTAIFVSWDDWEGFYDQVVPPTVDQDGYGLRVPGLLISPYAKRGYIDHQLLSHDAYLKFVEDDFLDSERLDPATDGRPDLRPDVRENAPVLGDLSSDFDFTQPPRLPVVLSVCPATQLTPPPTCN